MLSTGSIDEAMSESSQGLVVVARKIATRMSAASSLIPLNFQIAEEIAGGCIVYTVLMILSGKTRKLHWFLGVLSLLFVLHFVTK